MLDLRPRGLRFQPHWCHCVVSFSKNINASLVLVQPRNNLPNTTERLLMGRKETNQTITLPSRQRVSSGKGFICIGGINLMILTQDIFKTMFVCCHKTDSLKIPPTKKIKKNMAVSQHFGKIFLL